MPELDRGGSLVPLADAAGRLAMYLDTSTPVPTERPITGNATGPTINTTITPGPPGGDVSTGATTAVGAGLTVALPNPPANPRTQIVSIINSPGAFGLIRKAGGVAGTGTPLVNFGVFVYSEGIASLEFQNLSGSPAFVGIQWETN